MANIGFGTIPVFRHPGGLGRYPPPVRGDDSTCG